MVMKEQRRPSSEAAVMLTAAVSPESADRHPPVHVAGASAVPSSMSRCPDTDSSDTGTPVAATFQSWPASPHPPLPPTAVPQQYPPMPTPPPSTPPAAQNGLPAPSPPAEACEGPSSWTLAAELPSACQGVETAAGGEAAAWDEWWWELGASSPPLGSLDGLDLCGDRVEAAEGWLSQHHTTPRCTAHSPFTDDEQSNPC